MMIFTHGVTTICHLTEIIVFSCEFNKDTVAAFASF